MTCSKIVVISFSEFIISPKSTFFLDLISQELVL